MVLNKLFGRQRRPFLEISKAPATPVNVAPVQPVVEVESEPAMVAAIQLKQPRRPGAALADFKAMAGEIRR
ncbi:MAG: hypothetical protein EBU13_10775 [Synechococcaceae bacterium WB5_2A_257]|nr:hypothetical protein [Synechococcaceae bacterium WB5_2A_257]